MTTLNDLINVVHSRLTSYVELDTCTEPIEEQTLDITYSSLGCHEYFSESILRTLPFNLPFLPSLPSLPISYRSPEKSLITFPPFSLERVIKKKKRMKKFRFDSITTF